MYSRILVPVERSASDETILCHAVALARHLAAAVVIIHVADGWAARNVRALNLRESEEMRGDRDYIEQLAERLIGEGVPAEAILASGDPAAEIVEAATRERCDLIAMATHGHRFLNDVIRGSVANDVRHATTLPVLLLRTIEKHPTSAPQERHQ